MTEGLRERARERAKERYEYINHHMGADPVLVHHCAARSGQMQPFQLYQRHSSLSSPNSGRVHCAVCPTAALLKGRCWTALYNYIWDFWPLSFALAAHTHVPPYLSLRQGIGRKAVQLNLNFVF